MRKYVTTFAALTAVASGVAVLQLKATVQNKTDDVRALVRQIHRDREAIRVLEAEWAYQSAPKTLQENSVRFLALMPPKADQILSSATVIPFRPEGMPVESQASEVLLPTAYEKTADAKQKTGEENGKNRAASGSEKEVGL